jgi:hypothetical protein
MADNVVIVGVRRGPSMVPAGELRQMAGRAGRVHGGADARVAIVVAEEDVEYAKESLAPGEDPVVGSSMGDPDVLAFHILPEICSGRVTNSQDAALWHDRSFRASLGLASVLAGALEALEACGAVKEVLGRIVATPLGRVASSMYFHPADVAAWARNFGELFEMGLEADDVAAAWALGNIPVSRCSGDLGNKFWIVGQFEDGLPGGLHVESGSMITCVMWWTVLGGPSAGPMRGQAIQLKEDRQRVFGALRRIDKEVLRWGKIDYFDRLEFQAGRSIPFELVSLCRLPGIGKSMAVGLHEMGIDGPEDVLASVGAEGGKSDEEIGMIARGMLDGVS